MIKHRTISVDGLNVFVREAGDRNAPAIVLLHGYPTSSHMFRDLIPLLAHRFRVIAPDMVGYGYSDAPSVGTFEYTFDNLAKVTRRVLEKLEVASYILYVQDYGGPVGMRLALGSPERVRGLVIQNANAYMEGVSETVANLFMPLWKEQNATTIGAARGFLAAEATKMQYTAGARDASKLNPDAWTHDQALLDRPGVADAQLALFVDYQTNVAAYEAWHAYFRNEQPRTLVLWGKNDPFFLVPGAEAYRKDLKDVEVVLLDGGHFALEEHAEEVARRIIGKFAALDGEQLVASFYQHLASGDLGAALSHLSKDIHWIDPKGFPYGGRLKGPDEVRRRVFEAIGADWSPFGVHAERTIASPDGRAIVVEGRYTGTHRTTGRTFDIPFAHVWSAANGELTHFSTYTDTAELHAALGR